MTILQSLVARYDRMVPGGTLPVPGFAPAQISFAIVLAADGSYVTTHDERVSQGKTNRPRIVLAPAAPKRSSGIASAAFWDKTSYVFGRSAPDLAATPAKQARDAERLTKEHAAFITRHLALLDGVDDPGCQALLAFLRSWSPARFDSLVLATDMLDQNVAFRLQNDGGRFIHDHQAVRDALAVEAGARDGSARSMCLVTGTVGPIARLHPSIKGVMGAQSSGAALISFNLDAFTSHGKEQGANAPVSESAAFAYSTALNALLTPSGVSEKGRATYSNRVMLGETTVVFWAEHGTAEQLARAMLDEDAPLDDAPLTDDMTEATKLRDVFSRMQEGEPLSPTAIPSLDPASRVYVLGLSPNAARLSVRFWVEQSFAAFTARFQQHWDDLRLEPAPWSRPPALWRLLLELAPQRKSENIPAHLSGEVMRAILTGSPYPRALLTHTIMRIRADRDVEDKRTGRTLEKVSGLRVALLKACLARLHRFNQIPEDVPVSLDLNSTNSAYRLGRLFSVLERLQRAALGQRNATIRDRFYASASATPAQVFPSLIRNARNHSKSIRSKSGAGLAEWFEDHIADVASGLEGAFPKTLPLEEQGRFALGYYHQRDVFRRKKDTPTELEGADQAADESNGGES